MIFNLPKVCHNVTHVAHFLDRMNLVKKSKRYSYYEYVKTYIYMHR